LPDGADWLLRPVERGFCKYESLVDGTLGLEHVAEMNDAIVVADENQRRIIEALKRA
jgi:hypothetical protein